MRDIDKLLSAGCAAQTEKLHENSHKQGFPVDYPELFRLLAAEVEELKLEIHGVIVSERDPVLIRREAADVANFAHMIILSCDEAINGRE